VIIILIDLFLSNSEFFMITTIAFTALVIIEFLNILTEVDIDLYRFIKFSSIRFLRF